MKVRFVSALILAVLVALPSIADERSGPVGRMTVSAASVDWQSAGGFDRLVLIVSTPDGNTITREFQGNRASFRAADLAPRVVAEGTYLFELRAIPKISPEVKERLAAARAADDDAAVAKIKAEAGIGEPVVQAGAFSIHNGSFVTDSVEAPYNGPKTPKATSSNAVPGKLNPAPNDVVTADDEIIQGSLCVGLDCVVNESFGFDTIRLKENNTRIKFQDTSTSTGFPNVNWQLTANDSNSGGANKFSIDDITNSKTPFTVTAAAPTNSIFVASSGKVGFGNNNPGLNLHITATDTPAIRQEQTNGGGFTAQTWDIGANEANWFVRDLTGGSRLPLRIRPGAPTSSIDISATGLVGVGTASPAARLHVDATSTNNPGAGTSAVWVKSENNKDAVIGLGTGPNFSDNADGLVIAYNGNAAVGQAFLGTRPSTGTGNIVFAVKNTTKMTLQSDGLHVTDAVFVGGTQLSVPDYVFEPDYELMPLDRLAAFVSAEKHLPGIPSQTEIKKDGVNLAGLNMSLLRKVEELTLYTVQQNETIQKLEQRLASLEKDRNNKN